MFKLSLFLSLFLSISHVAFALEPVIIALGAPGSGKGTFSQYFKENHDYNHFSAGDLVRTEIEKKTAIGLQIADIVKRGEYIDTKIMRELIVQNIHECKAAGKPFIIDGFGRTTEDIEFLYELLSNLDLLSQTIVIFLDADDAICKERMSHRLLCSHCDRIYNSLTVLPIVEGECDRCFHQLKKRMNDTPEIIEKKISDYRKTVESHYRRSFDFFPYIVVQTNDDIESCLASYTVLARKIAQFEGDIHEF